MKRIMVIGISAGVGKSTFARKLGESLQIEVYHLDAYYWKPGWVEASDEDFKNSQKEMVKQEQWIIDGNYGSSFDVRVEQADTLIYLQLSLFTCLYRVVKRWIMNYGRTRSDLGEECPEKLDWKFIKFIITTYNSRKMVMHKRFDTLQASNKNIIILKSKREIHSFIENLNIKKNEQR